MTLEHAPNRAQVAAAWGGGSAGVCSLAATHWVSVQSLLTLKQSSFSEPRPQNYLSILKANCLCLMFQKLPDGSDKTLHIPLRTNTSPKRVNLFPELLPTNSSTGICLSLFSLWFFFLSCLEDTDLTHPSCSQNSSHTWTFWSQDVVACSPRGFSHEGAFNPRLIELQKASSLGTGGGGIHFSSERSMMFPLNNYNYLTVETVLLGVVPGTWTTLQWMAPQPMNLWMAQIYLSRLPKRKIKKNKKKRWTGMGWVRRWN